MDATILSSRIVSQILRSTRIIRKNELIAIFGLTAAITNKPEILALKQAQEKRNSDLYRTSIQYTILGNIHGKEVYLVPPQDAALLLQDRISPGLRKQLKQHNTIDGLGQTPRKDPLRPPPVLSVDGSREASGASPRKRLSGQLCSRPLKPALLSPRKLVSPDLWSMLTLNQEGSDRRCPRRHGAAYFQRTAPLVLSTIMRARRQVQ